MDAYDSYQRSPPPPSRGSMRERDDYRSNDPYRDRRRSPEPRRRDRDTRRRSRSPIDRYEPRGPRDDYYRDRRDDHRDRERRRSSPQHPSIDRYVPSASDSLQPQMLVNPLPDPMKLEFQVGFTWFAEWWRTEQRIKEEKERARTGRPPASRLRGERETREEREAERPKIQAAYDRYKEELQKSQAQSFVRAHKAEDWFRERYVPEVRDPFRQKLMNHRKGLFAKWEDELQSGGFDEFTLEGIYKSESNGLGGILEREEGETTAAAEVLGVGDLLPSKGGDLRDPVSQEPTLLIKTIAPTVTREKFEHFAKEHLGSGEDAKGGEYKWLSLSDPNPLKKCHRMGWIMLHPEPESQDTTVEPEEKPATTENGEEGEEGEANGQTSERPAGLSTAEKALANINQKTIEDPERGNFTVHCGVHRPPDAPRKKALWDLFSAPERIARDLDLATRLVRRLDNELGDEYFGVAKIEQRVQDLADAGALQPPAPAPKAAKQDNDGNMDTDAPESGEEEEEGQLEDDEERDDEELLIKKKKLDLLVEYLRRVYNFCFFCVFESDSVHELQRKCPGGHLRRPRASLTTSAKEVARASALGDEFPLRKNGTSKSEPQAGGGGEDADMGEGGTENGSPEVEKKPAAGGMRPSAKNAQQLQRAFNWVKTFEEKILQVLEPENCNLRKLGGVPVDEGVEEELNKFVKQEDANKYRCKVPDCSKLFKGPDFWRKHVEKRHEDFHAQVHDTVNLVNTYVLDPAHIAPSRSDANSNGHFPLGNHAGPTGTPRGFQLNQYMGAAAAGAGGYGPVSMGMPVGAGMPQNGTAMFAPPAGYMPGMAGIPGVGPIRSMGGGRNHFSGLNGGARGMPGPYARNDGRGMRGAGTPAMMMAGRGPMGAMGMGMGVEGGAGAMGPREAVAGRQLRSYEDLDADKGEGTGELNY